MKATTQEHYSKEKDRRQSRQFSDHEEHIGLRCGLGPDYIDASNEPDAHERKDFVNPGGTDFFYLKYSI